jgi:D-glycero-D-manno-heptose 1,7-bisphosphate phosphatase
MWDRDDVAQVVDRAKGEGKKIGFTSGVFDLLHFGHVDYLARAKGLCDFLVVGINSDSSVRANKGEKRPIQTATDRASIVAALKSVDAVFIFGENNNNVNVSLFKPNIYIKAGDYAEDRLSSASLVRQFGGEVKLVDFIKGRSSSGMIDTILARYGDDLPRADRVDVPEKPAIFADRDGVINKEIEYLHKPEQFELVPGALEALKKAQDRGFRVIVATNQAGIGLGYFTREEFFRVNREMLKAAGKIGLNIDGVYYCPHAIGEGCACRKPQPGMLLRAAREKHIDLAKSIMIGDRDTDVAAGAAAGCRTGIVGEAKCSADFRGANLADVIEQVLK